MRVGASSAVVLPPTCKVAKFLNIEDLAQNSFGGKEPQWVAGTLSPLLTHPSSFLLGMYGFKRFPVRINRRRYGSSKPGSKRRTHSRSSGWSTRGRRAAVTRLRSQPPSSSTGSASTSSTPADSLVLSLINSHLAATAPRAPDEIKDPCLACAPYVSETKDEKKGFSFDDDLPPVDFSALKAALGSSALLGARKVWRIKVGSFLSLSTNGVGTVNSIVSTSTLASVAQFASLANLFNEFFVVSLKVHFVPLAMFGVPISAITTPASSNQPLAYIAIHGTQATYTSATSAASNQLTRFSSSGVPYSYTWYNQNRYKYADAALQGGTATAYGGWCPVTSVNNYLGGIQFLSSLVTSGQMTTILGSFHVTWDVAFRTRD